MSVLFPAFLAGLGLVAVPILLHLARRRTGREIPFGSLMFLAASPPRFERRRRVEHLLLLALRALAIALLVLAFARPFLDRPPPALAVGGGERVVVLLDASASMRRERLWAEAVGKVEAIAARAGAADEVAIYTFDRGARPLVGFEEWGRLPPGARAGAVAARLAVAQPGYGGTDLGRALVAAADALGDEEGARGGRRRVVVVSDLQQGSRLDALAGAAWPRGVALALERVAARGGTNAAAQAVSTSWASATPAAAPGTPGGRFRVRVTNAAGGAADRFALRWEGATEGGPAAEVEVAPGQARAVELAPSQAGTGAGTGTGTLVLTGDDADFDNRLFVAGAVAARVKIVYVGVDAEAEPDGGPLYYLRRAFSETRLRSAEIVARRPGDGRLAQDLAGAHLAVAAGALPAGALAPLEAHLARGRSLLVAPADGASFAAAASLAGLPLAARPAPAGPPALLTQLDFSHPILAPLAEPRFADFTKVRFWGRLRVDEAPLAAARGARVVARFDDGAAAWLALPAGPGAVFLMASGWHADESQLALSTKFVPVLHAILEASAGLAGGQAQVFVGDPVPLPPADGRVRSIRRPDGRVVPLAADAEVFGETDVPGLYALEGDGAPRTFAVNVPPAESATAPLPPEALERLGAGEAAGGAARKEAAAAPAAAHRARLESEQKGWRWLLAAALAALVAESWIAARLGRRRPRSQEVAS